MKFPILLIILFLPFTVVGERLIVGHFSAGDLGDWQSRAFQGETDYRISETSGNLALRAVSDGQASGLYREIHINLTETPYIRWSWKIDNILEGIDERTRDGDDFPARVYVVASGGALFWRTRSLVYVWSSHQPVDSLWQNPYTGNARHIAVRSGPEQTGRWLEESRNLREDWERAFGDSIDGIDAVAIMTDTDNSGLAASAWYGDIMFSSQPSD